MKTLGPMSGSTTQARDFSAPESSLCLDEVCAVRSNAALSKYRAAPASSAPNRVVASIYGPGAVKIQSLSMR